MQDQLAFTKCLISLDSLIELFKPHHQLLTPKDSLLDSYEFHESNQFYLKA